MSRSKWRILGAVGIGVVALFGTIFALAGVAAVSIAGPSVARAEALSSWWITVPVPSGWHLGAYGDRHHKVSMINADEGWIGAKSVVLHYEDDEFIIEPVGLVTNTIDGLDMVSSSDGWIAGTWGSLYRYDGTDWHPFTSPISSGGFSFYDLKMVSASDGWACGSGPFGPRMLHWNGSAWSEVPYPSPASCLTLSVVDSDDVWAVGLNRSGGSISHFDGTEWLTVTSPVTQSLFSIDMVSATDGWAVGAWGTIVHYDGTAWNAVASPTTTDLSAVDMISASEGWAGGTDLIYFDGTSWVTTTVKLDHPDYNRIRDDFIHDIEMVSSTEGWAVGQRNLLMRYTSGESAFSAIWDRLYLPRVFTGFFADG